jgi:hypothetical protein
MASDNPIPGDDEDLPDEGPLHQAIGGAISDYAQVEFNLASILQHLLKVDFRQAHAIFFAIQNTRARHELFQSLLQMQFKDGVNKYWNSCAAFLQTLAKFRNALAHWHTMVTIYVAAEEDKPDTSEFRLSHPVPGSALPTIGLNDLALFTGDCLAIRKSLSALIVLAKDRPDTLPEIFQRPIAHRNQAVLQPHRKPKAHQPQRPPSRPSALQKGKKPSAKQRRARALSALKEKGRTT